MSYKGNNNDQRLYNLGPGLQNLAYQGPRFVGKGLWREADTGEMCVLVHCMHDILALKVM